MYNRRSDYSSKKRRYPYSKKSSSGRSKYRKPNNSASYFTYDAPRAKSITRLNAAIGAELKQYVHEDNVSKESLQAENIAAQKATTWPLASAHGTMPCEPMMQEVRQGQTYNTRIGDKITVRSTDFRIRVSLNHAHYNQQMEDLAMFIILDKSPNGLSPKWDDVFHMSSDPDTLNQKAMKNENRFQILKTFYLPFSGKLQGDQPYTPAPKFCYHKLKKPLQIKYQANNNNLADVVENQIWLVCVTKSPKSTVVDHTNEGPFTIHYCVNIRYYDS